MEAKMKTHLISRGKMQTKKLKISPVPEDSTFYKSLCPYFTVVALCFNYHCHSSFGFYWKWNTCKIYRTINER